MLKGILSSDDLLAIVENKYDFNAYSTYELTGFTDDWTELFSYDEKGNVIPANLVEVFQQEIDPVSVEFLGDDKYEVQILDDIEGFEDKFDEVKEDE